MGGTDIASYLLGTVGLAVQLLACLLGARLLTRWLTDEEDSGAVRSVLFLLALFFFTFSGMIVAGVLGIFHWAGFVFVWLTADLLLYAFRPRGSGTGAGSARIPPPPRAPALIASGIALVYYFLWHATTKILNFQFDEDTIIYHLPVAIEWLQQGGILERLPFRMQMAPHHYANNILLNGFFLAPYRSSFLALIGSSLYTAAILHLIFVVIYSRFAQRHAWVAAMTTFLWLCLPKVRQYTLNTTGNDLAVALYWGWGILMLVRLIDRPNRRRAIPFLMALGLLWGAKHSGCFYAVSLLFVAALFLWPPFFARPGFRRRLGWLAASATVLTLPGWFWTLRTWIHHGNPFFPGSFALPGIARWEGVYSAQVLGESTVIRGFTTDPLDFLEYFLRNFVHEFGYVSELMLALLALSPFILIRSVFLRDRPKRRNLVVLTLLYVLAFFLYLRTPFSLQGLHEDWAMLPHAFRFCFPAVLCCLFLFAAMFDLEKRAHRVVFAGAALGMSAAAWEDFRPLLPVIGAFALAWFCARIFRGRRLHPRLLRAAAVTFLIGLAVYGAWLEGQWTADWGTHTRGGYPDVSAIDRAVERPQPLTVLYSGDPYLFPLYGPRLWNRVLFYPDDFLRWLEARRGGPASPEDAPVAVLPSVAEEEMNVPDPLVAYLLERRPEILAYLTQSLPGKEDALSDYVDEIRPDLVICASAVMNRRVAVPPLLKRVLRDKGAEYFPRQRNVYLIIYRHSERLRAPGRPPESPVNRYLLDPFGSTPSPQEGPRSATGEKPG